MGARRLRLLLFALLSTLGFTLVVVPVGSATSQADPPAPAPAAQEVSVDLVAFHARPEKIEITTGTTVTWVNKELFDYPLVSGSHEIKADDGSFASPTMAPGTRWSHRFLLPGTYAYHCAHHTDLGGQIVVTGAPIVEDLQKEIGISEPKPDDPTTWGFQPNDLIVTRGTTVVWRNNGTNKHTVTSNDNLFASPEIPPGGTFTFKFDQPGAFGYHCTPHPWMTASIRVVVPGGTAPPPPPPPPPAPPMAMTHRPAESAATAESRGPVRHEVDIVEVNPANPTSWTFDPPSLDARAGDTVVWHNTGSMKHTITASDGSFDSGLIPPDGTWSRTFTAPAFVDYHCTPHPWMKGILRVAALTGPPPAPPAGSLTAARTSAVAVPPPEPTRQGSGPVIHTVNIVEPSIADAMGWGFNPAVLDARAGDVVVWRNTGTLQHSVTSDTFDLGLINPGQPFAHRFDAPGVYAYHCTPHPWMKGIVRVTSAEGGPAPAIPAGLEPGAPSGGGHQELAAPTGLAGILPLRDIPEFPEDRTALKLGGALLLSGVIVGLTVLGAWRAPVKTTAQWTPGGGPSRA
jgi:plastocyanin